MDLNEMKLRIDILARKCSLILYFIKIMFANSLIIIILASGGHSFLSQAEFDENNLKVEVAGAYNKLVRWRRSNITDLLPDMIITHIMGGDYHLLEPNFTEILETEEKLRSQIESENVVPMRTQAAGKFYSLVVKMVTDFGNYETKVGTCGSSIAIEHLVPDLDNFFNYINDPENKNKASYLLIKTILKNFGTEKELKKSLNAMEKKNKITTALDDTRQIKDKYLERPWTEEPDFVCQSGLMDFKALVALEDRILEYIPHDECDLKSSTDKIDLTFDAALKLIDIALEDEELINALINQSATEQASDEYKGIKLLTNNSLALLSMTTVRDMISGHLAIGICENCSCKLRHKALQLHYSVNKLKNVFQSGVNECNDDWQTISIENDFFLFLKDVQGIDDIFEVFSSTSYMWYYKPHVGIPYSEMPVKHGIWWMASHILPFDTCERFYYTQIFRTLLERISQQVSYRVDKKAFDRCGTLPSIETYDSLIMTEKKRNMVYYEMIRKFNSSDIRIIFGLPESVSNPFGYEITLHHYFDKFRDEEILLDPAANENIINGFREYWIEKETIRGLPYIYMSQAKILHKNCSACEFYQFYKAIYDAIITGTMNYDEGRINFFPFEQEAYSEERNRVMSQYMEALSGCPSKRNNFINLLQSDRALLTSELMQKPEAFELYMGYIYSEEVMEFLTPQMVVDKIDYILGKIYQIPEEQFPDAILENYVRSLLDESGKMLAEG